MRSKGGLAAALIVLCVACAAATPAQGAATRAEYVAQAEPICIAAEKQAIRQAKRMFRKLKPRLQRIDSKFAPIEEGKFKKSDLRKIFSLIARISAKLTGPSFHIFDAATTQLRAIPPAPGDEAAVATWLAGRVEFTRLNFAANRAGWRGHVKPYFGRLERATKALQQGQAPVNAFGFQHCFIETVPSEIELARYPQDIGAYPESFGTPIRSARTVESEWLRMVRFTSGE